ncbi:phage integrase N-terminal SAM-like domain-containing protein [Lignipirellula cremea]|uniref:Integrase SAM-like N-terminal domain-containing protein n=1 Tax=Lignipirellula cremea TaxID=2528010 RepID=A0A518E014_9BACT|nr:phage integrase N-terminal SAM-like domain-containing protein [Lignipirellula cremea]QDU97424.1 hypothetical protein Pla8534_52720 [Lignipirellula cremea]
MTSVYSGAGEVEGRAQPPLLQEVRRVCRRLHMSIRTEKAYVHWIEEFLRRQRQLAGKWRHPAELGSHEVNEFLTYLAGIGGK